MAEDAEKTKSDVIEEFDIFTFFETALVNIDQKMKKDMAKKFDGDELDASQDTDNYCEKKRHNSKKSVSRKKIIPPLEFICDECDFVTLKKWNLTQHKLRHSGELIKCSKCSYQTNMKKNYDRHMLVHSSNQLFSCPECNYKCNFKGNMDMHILKHTKLYPHQCTKCKYVTARKEHLLRHERTHTNEKPFKCSKCEYKSSDISTLKRHALTIHTDVKPFNCELCDYRTACKRDLRIHTYRHTGIKQFICTECDFRTASKHSLVSHEQRNAGQIGYNCPFVCKFVSTLKCGLLQHLKLHLKKEKSSLTCPQCDYITKGCIKLINHMEIKHGAYLVNSEEDSKHCEEEEETSNSERNELAIVINDPNYGEVNIID